MAYITHLFTERYLLNIFSTNHSPKEKSTIGCCSSFQLLFSIVEILLRVYIVYCQHSYILIHQFNKKRMILQGFKLFPRDRIETTDPFYRLIPTLPIVVELVGGIGQSVGCRRKFPTLLQPPLDLVLLHLCECAPATEECRCSRTRMCPCRHYP